MKRHGRYWWFAAWLVAATAWAQTAPADWQAEFARVRALAENDAPGAREQAQRLLFALPASAPAAQRTKALNVLARAETYMGLTETAADHAATALTLASQQADRIGQAEANLNIAINAINRGQLDEMVRAVQDAATELEGTDRPELLGEAMLRVTVMYRRFEEYEESAAVAVQGMEVARRSGHPLALMYAEQGLAIAFERSGRTDEMAEHYAAMRRYARLAGSKLSEGFAVAGLAGAQAFRGDLAGAERLQREALALHREVGAPFAESFGLFGVAELLARQNRHAESLRLLEEAERKYLEHPNRIGMWFVQGAKSQRYEALGDRAHALEAAERSYALARELGHAIYLSSSAARLAALAAERGDYRRAYELTTEAAGMTDRYGREKAGDRMVHLMQRYERESKQREIADLQHRNEQQAASLHQRELQQRWLATLLGGSALLLAGATWSVLRLRQSQRQLRGLNEQRQRSESEVRALNVTLEQRVQERTGELNRRKAYLRTLINLLPMWAWFKDTQGRYLVVSAAHAKARGHEVDEVEGRTDAELLPAPEAAAELAEDEQVMGTRERRSGEKRLRADGGEAWLETYKAPVLDADGTLLGTVGVARDISERHAAEAAREAALEEARKLARQRSEFLAQMSHELRTPLNGILGFAQTLRRDRALTERQARGLRIIEESGRHLLALINDILDLARIDAAKLELQPADVDLAAFLQVVTDIVRVKAEEKNLLFDCETAPDLPRVVRGDEKRLRQVLLNLLSNAVKFTDAGRVTLAVSRQGGAAGQARLRFEVRDQGIGMSEEQMRRLFEPFEQLGDARRREGGSGLGLAISRRLAQLMGGAIGVRSRPGEGSVFCFEVELPVSEVPVRLPPLQGVVTGYQGPRRRVLIAEDVPQNRAMLADALGTLGFEVAEAADGAQAVTMADAFAPDLVLMDLMMPVMDGFEATRRLRASPRWRSLPVAAMSASTAGRTEAEAREAGADAFVAKPVDLPVLLGTIGALLSLAWIHQAPESVPAALAGH